MTDTIRSHVRETFHEFEVGWNAHDPTAMAQCWIEEGNAVDPWGRFAFGRDGVIRLLAGEHETSMKESSYRVLSLELRELSAEAVVADCEAVIEGVLAPNGHPYELPHRVEAVLVLREERWRFLSLHPSFRHA